MTRPELCIIANPKAGRGLGSRRFRDLQSAFEGRAEFRLSERPGHAEELALEAARVGFPRVGAAGGDGTVHEVACGLLRADPPTPTLVVFPVGSANDYAHSLGLGPDWWRDSDPDLAVREVDVGVVRSGSRERHFVNGLGLGFNGYVTLESRRIRWLRGVPLYTLALLRALCFRYRHDPMTVTIDGVSREVPTLALTVALGRREGNFVLAPDAVLDDGLFDYLHAGPLSRWELLRHVPGMVAGRLPADHPRLWRGRCREVDVTSSAPLVVHVDGEFFCRPEEDVRSVAVRLLPRRLPVLRLKEGS